MKNQIVLLSDIHLERKTTEQAKYLLDIINESNQKIREKGFFPVVVLAGDVAEGTNGIEWASQINTKVIYVCGNHEFWNQDYFDVIDSLKAYKSKNVHFLHNDFITINDQIFVGGTLWTDVGEKLNKDLEQHAIYKMNDTFKITAKKWYESPQNLDALKTFINNSLPDHGNDALKSFIDENKWNILIERQENKKTTDFLNTFGWFVNLIRKYDTSNLKNWSDFLNFQLLTKNKYLQSEIESYEKFDVRVLSDLFNRLKDGEVKNKKIVLVTHHLPLLEECLIGSHENLIKAPNQIKKSLNAINKNIFLINKGLDYPIVNYFWRLSKRDIPLTEDIVKIIHYHNNGNENIWNVFWKNIDLMVHGHEHNFNYQDTLRAIPIATNPMGSSFNFINIANNTVDLNPTFKKYHQLNEEESKENLDRIKQEMIRAISLPDLNQEKLRSYYKACSLIWVLKNSNLDELNIQYNQMILWCKRILTNCVKNDGIELEKINSKVLPLQCSFNYYHQISEEFNKDIQKSFQVRVNEDFSFFKHEHGLLDPALQLGSFSLSSILKFNEKINTDIIDVASCAFDNMYALKQKKNLLNKIINLMNNMDISRFSDIAPKDIEKINNLLKHESDNLYGNSYIKEEEMRQLKDEFFDKKLSKSQDVKDQKIRKLFNF